jgi:hypothetical protein
MGSIISAADITIFHHRVIRARAGKLVVRDRCERRRRWLWRSAISPILTPIPERTHRRAMSTRGARMPQRTWGNISA